MATARISTCGGVGPAILLLLQWRDSSLAARSRRGSTTHYSVACWLRQLCHGVWPGGRLVISAPSPRPPGVGGQSHFQRFITDPVRRVIPAAWPEEAWTRLNRFVCNRAAADSQQGSGLVDLACAEFAKRQFPGCRWIYSTCPIRPCGMFPVSGGAGASPAASVNCPGVKSITAPIATVSHRRRPSLVCLMVDGAAQGLVGCAPCYPRRYGMWGQQVLGPALR